MSLKLKYLLFILALTVSSFKLTAQSSNVIDFNQLANQKEDFQELGKTLRKIKYDSIKMFNFIKISREKDYIVGEIFAYNMLGKINRMNTNFSKSLYYHQKALNLAENNNLKDIEIYILNMIGVVYRRMDAVKSALEYHNKALEKAESLGYTNSLIKKNIAISHNSIGNIYLLLERDDLAYKHFNKALEIEEGFNNLLGLAINYQNIGSILENRGELDNALIYYNKSLKINEKIHSKVGKIICYNSVGNIYLKQGFPQKALKTIQPSLLIAIELGDGYYLSEVYVNLGKIYIAIGDFSKAKLYLQKGEEIAKNNHIPSVLSETFYQYSILSEKLGNFSKALAYHKKYTTEQNKILNKKNQQLIADVVIKQIKLENQQKLDKLGKENIEVKEKLEKTKFSFYTALLLSLVLFLLFFIFYKQYQIKNERKMINVEQKLLRAQMNPHFIFNSMNSIKMFIIHNKQKDAVTFLSKLAKLIRAILNSTIEKESSLQEEIDVINMYVSIENTRFSNSIVFSLNVDDSLEINRIMIPSLLSQPFIENAIWHGLSPKRGVKELTINIYLKKKSHFAIEIIDNGIGRKRAMKIKESRTFKRTSIGIQLSKERLLDFSRNLKSTYNLQFVDLFDLQGKALGTKVIIEIPIKFIKNEISS